MKVQFPRLFLVGLLFATCVAAGASAQVSWTGQLKAFIFGGAEKNPQPKAAPSAPAPSRATDEISTSQSRVEDYNEPVSTQQASAPSESADAIENPELTRPESAEPAKQASSNTKSSPQPTLRQSTPKTAAIQPTHPAKPANTASPAPTSTAPRKDNSRFAHNYQLCRKAYSDYSSARSSAAKAKMFEENCKRWASNPDKETLALYESTYGQPSARNRSGPGFLHWIGERLRPVTGAQL
jgi:septal ring-binding cell division protein DamX